LVGKTSLRGLIRLMHWADGVVCPVTFAMHLAAATPRPSNRPGTRPGVIIAGGREPTHWEAYPHHRFLSTVGALSCCHLGGCWKSRCHKVGDGDPKDWRNLCESPVPVSGGISIPRCMEMIQPDDVVRNVLSYYEGGIVRENDTYDVDDDVAMKQDRQIERLRSPLMNKNDIIVDSPGIDCNSGKPQEILILFSHGLGDSIQFTSVLEHLRVFYPDWKIDVAAHPGCYEAMRGLCRNAFPLKEVKQVERNGNYDQVFRLAWKESRSDLSKSPSTKTSRCLEENFKLSPQSELCRYSIHIPDATRESARRYMESIGAAYCDAEQGKDASSRFRTVVIHYQGRTSREKKDLSQSFVRQVVQRILKCGRMPIILDWNSTPGPLINQRTVHCPRPGHPIWSESKEGTASGVAALIEASEYMIGIDSGPLHIAGAVNTPTVGIWTRHHPIHYFDHADNVEHWVPRFHERLAAGPAAVEYFRKNYRHQIYGDLEKEFLVALTKRLQE
jgi:ADP-heptose:LPS heptosyltransferase